MQNEQKLKYPNIVKLLRESMLGNGDKELAAEVIGIVNEYSANAVRVSLLEQENEALHTALQVAQNLLDEASQEAEPLTPQFPADFYSYGGEYSIRVDDEEVQNMIDDVYDEPLEDGQYYELSQGGTLVIKTRDNGVEKIIVAQGYQEAVITDVDDECCGDPDCGSCHVGYGF